MHTSGYGPDDLEKLSDYDTVVIDAQFFSAEVIGKFKAEGQKVFFGLYRTLRFSGGGYIYLIPLNWMVEDVKVVIIEEEVWPEKTGCNVYVLKKRDRWCKVAA